MSLAPAPKKSNFRPLFSLMWRQSSQRKFSQVFSHVPRKSAMAVRLVAGRPRCFSILALPRPTVANSAKRDLGSMKPASTRIGGRAVAVNGPHA